MTKIINLNIFTILNLILIFLILSINTSFGIYLDGLPWNGKIENILILCILPIILIFNLKFIFKKKFFYLFLFIFLFKFSSSYFFSQKGIYFDNLSNIKKNITITKLEKYLKDNDQNNDLNKILMKKIDLNLSSEKYLKNINLNKTFDTFWNKGHSSRITKPLLDKQNFPLDWTRGIETKLWDKLNITFRISGFINLKKNELFVIEAKGLKNLEEVNQFNKNIFFINNIDNFKELNFKKNKFELNQSKIKIDNLNLNYSSNIWSFTPYIFNIDNKKLYDAFKLNRVNVNDVNFFEEKNINKIYLILAIFLEFIFIFILLFWFIETINKITSKIFLNCSFYIRWLYIFIFYTIPIIIYYLFEKLNFFIFNINDIVNTFQLSIAIIFQVLLLFLLTFLKKIKIINPTYPLLFLILFPSLFYFAIIFSNNIYNIINFPFSNSQKDDWSIIHIISRLISLGDFKTSRMCLLNFYEFSNDNWLSYIKIDEIRNIICNKESLSNVYFHNPLYRYFLSLFFTIFGHGSFILQITDLWSIIFITVIMSMIIHKNNFTYHYSFITSLLYLTINLAGPYRYLIGRGKEEYISLFFIFIAIYIFYFCKKNKLNFLFAIIISTIAFLLRIDYIFLIFAIIFFYFEPFNKNILDIYKKIFTKYFITISIFYLLILSSIILLIIRSYIISDYLFPIHPSQFSLAMNSENSLYEIFINWINHLNYVFSAGTGFPNDFRFPSVFLISGSLFIVLLFFKIYKDTNVNFPYSISICLILIILSFVIFQTSAYPPRASIHILPFSIIGFTYILYTCKKFIVLNLKKFNIN